MKKVITYGTFDLLHYGHIRLLERARALGDYLIVGVTSDDYDKTRGKINNQQSLIDRIRAVKDTGLADEIIVEEYEGQKIDDIQRYDVDVFTIGSDWEGKYDYLNEYCKVVYLPRTEGISSSDVRTQNRKLEIGIVGSVGFRQKIINEAEYVNGVDVVGIFDHQSSGKKDRDLVPEYEAWLKTVDAVYILSKPENHYSDTKNALLAGKHVICEAPIAFSKEEAAELFSLAKEHRLVLMEGLKTAYATAYERLVLLVKGGRIGKVVSVDAVCTSLRDGISMQGADLTKKWNSICSWAPTALLPVFQILGTGYVKKQITTMFLDKSKNMDAFTKIDFLYQDAVASIKVAKGAKAEGELIITGTEGYAYVPAPWWKTDYFEIRYENSEENKRFFYQLEGEGIRYEIVEFAKSIESNRTGGNVSEEISSEIAGIIGDFNDRIDFIEID
ncbi:MAG: adenylyltransferase/cytidyltransferase family protein [Clostridia bacterium]|nr:adenylyltransferase/cytidyltransferase family protein [Clostridia bacterium]